MSLDQLRAVRRAGQRPASVVVLIGRANVDEDESIVQVRDRGDDLRALIGLPVHVIDIEGDTGLTTHVIEILESLKAVPLGICGPVGSCGVSPEHEHAMQSYRRTLCRS